MKDCIVVGAGLSGLFAAYSLGRNMDVTVLEARERTGGRILTKHEDGIPFDLGAQWIGEDHYRLTLLAAKLELPTVPSARGREELACDLFGRKRTVWSVLPEKWMPQEAWPLSMLDLPAALAIRNALDDLVESVDPCSPWKTPNARFLDQTSVAHWMAHVSGNRKVVGYAAFLSAAAACSSAHEMSILGVAAQLRKCGGAAKLERAERDIFLDGAQSLTNALECKLARPVELGVRVTAIRSFEDRVEVQTTRGERVARRAIVAVPPPLAAEIRIDGDPVPQRRGLLAGMQQGRVTKYVVGYDQAFWRQRGLNGRYIGDRYPVDMVFDGTRAKGEPHPRLVAFVRGANMAGWGDLPKEERQRRVLEVLKSYLGDDALCFSAFKEKNWTAERWSRGGFGASYPPGVLTDFPCSLAEPAGRIHWAGTETASEWPNYMEGALQAGGRAAQEVAAAF